MCLCLDIGEEHKMPVSSFFLFLAAQIEDSGKKVEEELLVSKCGQKLYQTLAFL